MLSELPRKQQFALCEDWLNAAERTPLEVRFIFKFMAGASTKAVDISKTDYIRSVQAFVAEMPDSTKRAFARHVSAICDICKFCSDVRDALAFYNPAGFLEVYATARSYPKLVEMINRLAQDNGLPFERFVSESPDWVLCRDRLNSRYSNGGDCQSDDYFASNLANGWSEDKILHMATAGGLNVKLCGELLWELYHLEEAATFKARLEDAAGAKLLQKLVKLGPAFVAWYERIQNQRARIHMEGELQDLYHKLAAIAIPLQPEARQEFISSLNGNLASKIEPIVKQWLWLDAATR